MEFPRIAKFLTGILIATVMVILFVVFYVVENEDYSSDKTFDSKIEAYQVSPKNTCLP